MSRTDVAFLSRRITALVFAMFAVAQLWMALGVSLPMSAPAEGAGYPGADVLQAYSAYYRDLFLVPGLVFLATAAGLFLGARRLARSWFPGEGDPPGRPLDTYGLQAVAFSVVGLVLLALALPGTVATGPLFAGLQAAIGLLLFFGARRLAAAWHRKAGKPAAE